MRDLVAIAQLECISVARMKWVRLLTAAFALLSIGAAYASGAAAEVSGADGFARTTMTLVPIALILVPLAAIVLGVAGQTAEAGGEAFLFAQPVSRTSVLLGRWTGETVALGGSIVAGFGIGGAAIATMAGPAGLWPFAGFVALSVLLGAIFLSLAAAIASMADTRVAALGVATFVWFFFVLLFDALALSVAGRLTGTLGGRVLFGSLFGNPAGLIRISMLLIAGTSNVLGAAGDAWTRFLGGPLRATAVSAMALAVWTAAPLVLADAVLRRRDL